MTLLECINDSGYSPEHLQWIKQFPVKGEIYTLRGRVHTINGLGYLLDEIKNPMMPNGKEPNFSAKRFKLIDDINIDDLLEETIIKELEECI